MACHGRRDTGTALIPAGFLTAASPRGSSCDAARNLDHDRRLAKPAMVATIEEFARGRAWRWSRGGRSGSSRVWENRLVLCCRDERGARRNAAGSGWTRALSSRGTDTGSVRTRSPLGGRRTWRASHEVPDALVTVTDDTLHHRRSEGWMSRRRPGPPPLGGTSRRGPLTRRFATQAQVPVYRLDRASSGCFCLFLTAVGHALVMRQGVGSARVGCRARSGCLPGGTARMEAAGSDQVGCGTGRRRFASDGELRACRGRPSNHPRH